MCLRPDAASNKIRRFYQTLNARPRIKSRSRFGHKSHRHLSLSDEANFTAVSLTLINCSTGGVSTSRDEGWLSEDDDDPDEEKKDESTSEGGIS